MWPLKYIPKFEAAVRDVKSKNPQFRRFAAIALGSAPPEKAEEAASALAVLLDDPDSSVRLEALLASAALRAASLAPRVSKYLDSENVGEKLAALQFMARAGGAEHREVVLRLLEKSENDEVRCAALEALSYIDEEACRGYVLGALEDGAVGSTTYLQGLIEVLGEIGREEDLGVCVRYLRHPDAGVRLRVAHLMAFSDRTRNTEGLLETLLEAVDGEKDHRLRQMALEALCRMRAPAAAKMAEAKLRKLFISKYEKIHWAAIGASAGDKKAKDYLERVYGGRNRPQAAVVLWAAGLCGLTDWIPVMEKNIRRTIEEREYHFLQDSIAALGVMECEESKAALKRLEALADGKDPEVAALIRQQLS